jgi:hypothetical protein
MYFPNLLNKYVYLFKLLGKWLIVETNQQDSATKQNSKLLKTHTTLTVNMSQNYASLM